MEIKLCTGELPHITLWVWSKRNAFLVPISSNPRTCIEMQYSVLPFLYHVQFFFFFFGAICCDHFQTAALYPPSKEIREHVLQI